MIQTDILISSIRNNLFGLKKEFNLEIKENLGHQIFLTHAKANLMDLNGPKELAMVGDNVLKLLLSLRFYKEGYSSEYIEINKQKLESNEYIGTLAKKSPKISNYLIAADKNSLGLRDWSTFFEALLGAIYLSEGMEQVESFLKQINFYGQGK